MKIQLVETHNHHLNAAKCAMQTFKNHMIVGLCTAITDFSALLCDYLIPQAQGSKYAENVEGASKSFDIPRSRGRV